MSPSVQQVPNERSGRSKRPVPQRQPAGPGRTSPSQGQCPLLSRPHSGQRPRRGALPHAEEVRKRVSGGGGRSVRYKGRRPAAVRRKPRVHYPRARGWSGTKEVGPGWSSNDARSVSQRGSRAFNEEAGGLFPKARQGVGCGSGQAVPKSLCMARCQLGACAPKRDWIKVPRSPNRRVRRRRMMALPSEYRGKHARSGRPAAPSQWVAGGSPGAQACPHAEGGPRPRSGRS